MLQGPKQSGSLKPVARAEQTNEKTTDEAFFKNFLKPFYFFIYMNNWLDFSLINYIFKVDLGCFSCKAEYVLNVFISVYKVTTYHSCLPNVAKLICVLYISWLGHDKHAIVKCRDWTELKTDAWGFFYRIKCKHAEFKAC